MKRVVVLGIGSPTGDDRAGWLVIDALEVLGVREGSGLALHRLDRPGASLVALLEGCDRAVVVDAMQSGAATGTVRRLEPAEWADAGAGLSSHGFGVASALALAAALENLPAQLDVYGIELAAAPPGQEVSKAVVEGARRLARQLASELANAAQEA